MFTPRNAPTALYRTLAILGVCLMAALQGGTAAAAPKSFDHLEAELVSGVERVAAGEPFWVALRLKPDSGWGTYWRNPGRAGLPTRVEWTLPEGASAGPIQWPAPAVIQAQGVASYGYKREVLLPMELVPPASLEPGERFQAVAQASWLVCASICIPGEGRFELDLPVGATAVAAERARAAIGKARDQVPRPASGWTARFAREGERVVLAIDADEAAFDDAGNVRFFPYDEGVVAPEGEQRVRRAAGDALDLAMPAEAPDKALPEAMPGVLVVERNGTASAYALTATPGQLPGGPATSGLSIVYVVVIAMLGGLLLNLMPCVFPVLSFKAVMLLESAAIGRRVQRLHGIAYTLGVIVFFSALGGVLYVLKAGGSTIGWGFQLQAPWFVAAITYLLVLVGLSFSGLLTVGTSIMGVGSSLADRGGYAGSFATGALAAIVATPCTAPFMGTAVAYAIARPPIESLVVFIALGLGMALPFLLVAFIPAVGRLLPKPGPWMNVFKELMAFPLYLTALWLLWVVGRQTGPTGMAVVLGGLLFLVFAVWLRHQEPHGRVLRGVNLGSTVLATVAAFALLAAPVLRSDAPAAGEHGAADAEASQWIPYSDERLAELRAQGTPVFVNLTADWCISCIANERVALSAPSVHKAFERHGVVLMEGDWTRRDERITRVLERFGRNGVPLYLLYPGDGGEPQILPQWLTPGIVINAVEALDRDQG